MLFLLGIRPNFIVTAIVGVVLLAIGLLLSLPIVDVIGGVLIVAAIVKAVVGSNRRAR